MLLEVITDIDSPSGYSKHARNIVKAAFQAGVGIKVTRSKHDKVTIELDDWWKEHLPLFEKVEAQPDVAMHIETPEFYQPQPGVVNIGFTAWETNAIPGPFPGMPPNTDWITQMNLMDEVWTPANFAIEAFARSGVTSPTLRYMPLPIDMEQVEGELGIVNVTVDPAGRPLPAEHRPFVIGSMGQWTWRKNIDEVALTVLAEFKASEVVLLLKTYGSRHGDEQEEERIRQKVMGLKTAVMKPDQPNIVLVQTPISDLDINRFYNSLDVYFTMSRGEGFCIPAAQAMAYGVPTVATGWSAFPDYIEHEKTGWLVDYHMEPVFGMPHIPWYRPDQQWAKPDMAHAMHILREVYESKKGDREMVDTVASAGQEFVTERFSPQAIGQMIKDALEEAVS
jgi:glycosyltransferase involved in cell wall biosynthesis